MAWHLCAACSCREKELNPGVDLLLTADWDGMLDQPAVMDKTTPPSDMKREEQPPGATAASAWPERRRWLRLAVAGAALLVVLSGARALQTLTRKGRLPAGHALGGARDRAG